MGKYSFEADNVGLTERRDDTEAENGIISRTT